MGAPEEGVGIYASPSPLFYVEEEMQKDARLLFQGKCLQSSEGKGYRWMEQHFDRMPPEVRARLRVSDFNLCSACVYDLAWDGKRWDFIKAIEIMEEQIRASS